ncbi:phosphomevalonate kinase, partial [Vermiconidia calcicola]
DADLNLNRNAFLETSLVYALSYIAAVSSPVITPASVTILADNDYYSTPSALQNGDSSSKPQTNGSSTPTESRFQNFGVPLRQAHKTGLGSSAALVTAFTAAILSYYLPKDLFDLSSDTSRRRLHNLAQAAHCAAQGKVGSGFDVASAVYGSCLYRRFSPSILSNAPDPGTEGFGKMLRGLVDETGIEMSKGSAWDTEIHRDAIKVPTGLRLVMCDVSCGSQTPGMVKKVLAWRKANSEEAEEMWRDLHAANEALALEMKTLAESQSQEKSDLERLRQCFSRIRQGIRLMSEKSGVPIEPSSQTELLDACEAVGGVVGGVVPGAGGYDAISLLIEDKEEVIVELGRLLEGWKFKGEAGTVEGGGKVSMLGVREEMQGVRVEGWKEYEAWLS